MKHVRARRGFTLLEMTAVVALLALTVGMATMRVSETADSARLSAAAAQIASVYRLGVFQAARSGRPRILSLDQHSCVVKEPVYRDGEWLWSPRPRIELVRGVIIAAVYLLERKDVPSRGAGSWDMMISPGAIDGAYSVVLKLNNGVEATYLLDGLTGAWEPRAVATKPHD